MNVLVLVACLAAAASAQVHLAGHAATGLAAGPISHYEKVVETSAQPEYLVQFQQPASLLVKSVEQQVPVTGFQQTAYVSGQPASYLKTVEKIENPALLNGEIQKFEKIEKIDNVQKVELPSVTAYSGGYQQSAYIQKQPALASLSGYKTIEKQFVSSTPAPIVSTYTSSLPLATTYKQQSAYVAQPAVATYKKEFVAPAVSSYAAFPAAAAYKKESTIYSASPVSAYGASFQKDALLYSQSAAKYGGSAMFPGNYQSAEGSSSILKLYKDDIGTGAYQYGYATSNGINHDEEGKVLASGSKSAEGSSAVSGSYSYTGPDGVTYTVKYTADEQGFRAYGDHLPKLSEEAQRAIDESAKYGEQKDY